MLENGKMEREQIERLAMDSAAGQLNEDAQMLFEEYLTEHPEANNWAEDMLVIYRKTETAIAKKIKRAVMPDTNMINAGAKPYSMSHWLSIARWAAVVVFAALIGVSIGRWTKSSVLSERPVQVSVYPDMTVKRTGPDIGNTGESFWREKALAMFQAKPSTAHTGSITGPTLWEKYRQLIKDRHYE
jgi:predicted anti-sigma-YlaC factor YlaD